MPRAAIQRRGKMPPRGSPRRSQRERQRAETRERIFAAALDEFRRVGAAAAEIPRIAAAAGVVRGTVYYHFPTKDDVLRELSQRVQRQVAGSLRELRAAEAPIAEVLARLAARTHEIAAELGEVHLLGDLMALHVRAPIAPEPEDEGSPLEEELALQLGAAIRRGEVPADHAPEALARLVLNSLFGLMAGSRTGESDRASDLDLMVEVFARALRA